MHIYQKGKTFFTGILPMTVTRMMALLTKNTHGTDSTHYNTAAVHTLTGEA
jgi:hypothetical protein